GRAYPARVTGRWRDHRRAHRPSRLLLKPVSISNRSSASTAFDTEDSVTRFNRVRCATKRRNWRPLSDTPQILRRPTCGARIDKYAWCGTTVLGRIPSLPSSPCHDSQNGPTLYLLVGVVHANPPRAQ